MNKKHLRGLWRKAANKYYHIHHKEMTFISRKKAKVARHYRKRREWFDLFKSQLKCINCSENHPATLDFHHRNPKDKYMEVSTMISRAISEERILNEVMKCDVLCANCHRKIHYGRKKS